MPEWMEEEFRNKELRAPCGLYCGVCGVYIATRDGNDKFKAVMGNLYGTKPEETECLGCMQLEPPRKLYGYCKTCNLRNCILSKGFYSCHQCGEWPCHMIQNFGLATGVRVMNRTIPLWRAKVAEQGDEKGSIAWAKAECERYHCPECGNPLFRGAKTCRVCKAGVSDRLDGLL
jgi:hypothetical protein